MHVYACMYVCMYACMHACMYNYHAACVEFGEGVELTQLTKKPTSKSVTAFGLLDQ